MFSEGGGNDDDDDESVKSPDDDVDDADYVPDGLVFSDDEECLVDVDADSEDERLRSSFPKPTDRTRKPIIPGGPQPPDLSNYPEESQRKAVWGKYVRERKKYCDQERHKRIRQQKSVSADDNTNLHTGDQTEQLRTMSEVEKGRLLEGQVFRTKDIVHLRIAEEANLRGISTRVQRSDVVNLLVVGVNFYVHTTLYENTGWVVHTAICREGDDTLQIPPRHRVDMESVLEKKGYLRIPIKARMVAPLIKEAVGENPSITYQAIHEIMKPYAKGYTLTDSIVQDGRDLAKLELLGDFDDNVKYAAAVQRHLRGLGHEGLES